MDISTYNDNQDSKSNKMKAIINFSITSILILIAFLSIGQQSPQFIQYFDNLQQVNAAYAGTRDVMGVTAIHREQWVGFAGRPRTSSLVFQTPLAYESVALGMSIMNDIAGPVNDLSIAGDFAYSVRMQGNRKLIFGLKAEANVLNVKSSSLLTTTEGDPALMQMVNNRVTGNVGLGVIYKDNDWIAGFSMPRLLQNKYRALSPTTIQRRHYYFLGGKVFDLAYNWKLRSMAQLRMTFGAPVSFDVSTTGIYRDKVFIGLMYRLDAAFGAFLQFQATNELRVGFGTEIGTQAIRGYNFGTFELMASYDFPNIKNIKRSPRYF
jgi:type IX secretion system PorP/SprF family membrane protein